MPSLVDLIFITMASGAAVLWLSLALNINLSRYFNQISKYGKVSKDTGNESIISKFDVPKSWFRYFYTFGVLYSGFGVYLAIDVYVRGNRVPECVMKFLDSVYGKDREPVVTPLTALIMIVLFNLHLIRRAYETWCIQIFSPKNNMSVVNYILGYLYYFGVITSILGKAPGFTNTTAPFGLTLNDFNIRHQICVPFFVYAMWNQHITNRMLANMRKDRSGKVATMRHVIPRGGFFEVISSPHMFFEIEIYLAALGMMNENITWTYIVLTVVLNQVYFALETHKWYQTKFKEYPKDRKAIFPNLL